MARNFRAFAKFLVPGWLSAGDGGLVIEAWMLLLDAATERMRQALDAHFPTRCGPSALPYHGRMRGIPRGRSETAEHYAARLVSWRYPAGHRVRGGASALLEQIGQYWGNVAQVQSVDVTGNRYMRDTAGAITAEHGVPWQWDEQPSTNWSRFWCMLDGSALFTEHPALGDEALYGGTLDPTSDYSVGQLGATPGDADAMRRLLTGRWMWRPAGTMAEWLIVDMTGSYTLPDDGLQARWSKVVTGTRSAARDADARYWSLAPARNNVDRSDAALFTGAPLLGESYCDGDPTSFPLSVESPTGLTLAGDPASFPTDVRLLDDGDHL